MAQVTVKDLAIGYEGRALAEKLNFEIKRGDYFCIVGENGAGKSTLMRTLLGLLPPLRGKVLFENGENGIGYLPQQTQVQKDFPATVREIVRSGCRAKKLFLSHADRQLAEDNMRRMEILPLQERSYRELSGGQQQRVLLARALCAADRILLLDEPTAGLDPKVTQEMYELIARLNREGVTVIMVSHDLEAAVRYANRILHLGRNVFCGTRDEYLSSRQYAKWGGGEA